MKKEEIKQHFLTRLGKIRLRPGGKIATDWLIANGDFNKNKKVLEVACHTASMSINIAKNYDCHIISTDVDDTILDKARKNIAENKVSELIEVQNASPNTLPFPDNHFDVVINEAMLTMLANEEKEEVVREYYRVLKPNGLLLTHDILLNVEESEAETVVTQLCEAIDAEISPLSKAGWKSLFQDQKFRNIETFTGELNLLSPRDWIQDEGVVGTIKIVGNALKSENREHLKKLFQTFNDPENKLGFIVLCSQK
ncbi:class I SAM-dependent methyltransferase [Otariodibacter sp.]|uniref:class I SAM-dependent methyltransferase n=1 Tax=Otariodibacter sp. TaxID=3030919 RepID=UPI00260C35B3|nr:class I SAM-dependent methyltransferase [Otariodibacter sp.]